MHASMRAAWVLSVAASGASLALADRAVRAATPVVVPNLAGFEGIEEPTVIYFPDTNTFQNDPTSLTNIVDEGGGMIRTTLRNNYSTLGWWDGDRATTNTDRQRGEVKGIDNLGHQKVGQTFEYSFDFRTDPNFAGTGHFCHLFQLKATDGNSGPPLVTLSLYKSGSTIQGRIISNSDSGGTTPRTFSYTAGQWAHAVVRITTSASNQSTGAVLTSIDGDAFSGTSNVPVYLNDSTDYRPKWGLYRGIMTDYGVPDGASWTEHRTVTGYIGTSNILKWKGGLAANAWDTANTQNFLIGASPSAFNTIDQVLFDDSTANANINISGNVWPGQARINASQNYTFSGTGAITGGTLRKDGSGTLTLATSNSYAGLTDVRAGTLLVSGSIGNNSLASITGGTLRAGSAAALGTNSTIGTQIDGGTLDINGFNLSTEPVQAAGAGAGGSGAIINSGTTQTSALNKVTLGGDATFGGSSRWDIRGTGAALGTSGNAFNLTKTGANQVSLVAAVVDPALGNITINQGILAFQTSTSSMGDSTRSVSVANGAVLGFYNLSNVMSKVCTLNGGTIWAESGSGAQNTFAGPVTLGAGGGIIDAGGGLTGGAANATAVLTLSGAIGGSGALTKNGPGTLTLAAASTFTGNTNINAGTLTLAANASLTSTNINVAGGATFNVNGTLTAGATVNVNGIANFAGSTGGSTTTRALAALSISSGDLATVTPSAFAFTPAILKPATLSFSDASAKLNLTNNELITSGTVGGFQPRITSGQIFSTSANGALGLIDIGGGQVRIRFTLLGDTNLDGTVDVTDLGNLASHYDDAGSTTWAQGDTNYDGAIDVNDLGNMASNYGSRLAAGSAVLSLAMLTSERIATVVPEPAAFGFALMGLGFLSRHPVRRSKPQMERCR